MTDEKNNDLPTEEIPLTAPSPQMTVLSVEQIQQASAAGVRLLGDEDLKAPIKDGQLLQILGGLLTAIAQGDLFIVGAADAAKLEKMRKPPVKRRPSSRRTARPKPKRKPK